MKWPQVIRSGSVRVKVYRVHNRGPWYKYQPVWFDRCGHRKRKSFGKPTAALEFAQVTADNLAAGGASLELNPLEGEQWSTAIKNLLPTGLSTDKATEFVARVYAVSKGDLAWAEQRLEQAAKIRDEESPTVDVAAAEFLAWQKHQAASDRHYRDLQSRLRPFRKDFQCAVGSITIPMVDRWLAGLKGTNRTRNNYLGAIRNFLTWCRKVRRYTSEVIELRAAAESASRNELWRPAEMRSLLEAARGSYRTRKGGNARFTHRTDEVLIPYLALGAFAKIRSCELLRMDWNQIRFDEGVIVISKSKAKTKVTRKIKMPENLVAWLRPYAKLSGRVRPYANVHRPLARLAERAGLKWRRNALRNSASTYHAILSNDLKLVSREAGNSPASLEANYLEMEGATALDAKDWFDIFPSSSPAGQIIELPGLFGG